METIHTIIQAKATLVTSDLIFFLEQQARAIHTCDPERLTEEEILRQLKHETITMLQKELVGHE